MSAKAAILGPLVAGRLTGPCIYFDRIVNGPAYSAERAAPKGRP
jgi:hypothetical protein